MPPKVRRDLAERQEALVAALVAGAPVPAGFVDDEVRITARSLLRKRERALRQAWPLLDRVWDESLRAAFEDYVRRESLTREGNAWVEGFFFAHHLRGAGRLSVSTCRELLRVEMRLKVTRAGVRRRWVALRIWRVPNGGRLLAASLSGRAFIFAMGWRGTRDSGVSPPG